MGETAADFEGRLTTPVIVEHFVASRRVGGSGADRLVLGPNAFGVVDGSTAKPWNDSTAPDGGEVADIVLREIQSIDPALSAQEAVSRISRAVEHKMSPGTPPGIRSCATFAVFVRQRMEVWRVGEQWIVVDGVVHAPLSGPESEAAHRRAEVLSGLLERGDDIADLLRNDPGRQAILPDLARLDDLRNTTIEAGHGAIDGSPLPDGCIEVIRVDAAQEIVIASDGYPNPAMTLDGAELALRHRLDADPLMIQDPPATKGVEPGMVSYDDRSFVRLQLVSDND